MKKRILTLFCVFALLVTLAIPAFAATYTVSLDNTNSVHSGSVSSSQYDSALITMIAHGNSYPIEVSISGIHKIKITRVSSSGALALMDSSNHEIAGGSSIVVGSVFDGVYKVFFNGYAAYDTVSATLGFDFVYPEPTVSPVFADPVQAGEYTVSDLIGTKTANRMYTTRDDPRVFTFTDVTANASTVVSYALEASGGVVTYHDIGTLTEDFTFKSSDYPVADFFTVRNNGSSTVSYTVTVTDDSFEKTQSMAQNIWETCLSMGTSMINWLKTPSNFIALIPLAMFVLVGAVLMIRKLIKGV